jgi:dTDP-4-dehydrorhamnose reductase
MKLLVVGASGQLSRALQSKARDGLEVIAIGRPMLDYEHSETVQLAVVEQRPDIVVSAGAHTAVDLAESEADRAWRINAVGPGFLAEVCSITDIPLIHISTDYVFSGDKAAAYVEADGAEPVTVYGRSKLEGERRIAAAMTRYAILRTAWVFSETGNNFLRTILRIAKTRASLNVVSDQVGCPTYANDLADTILTVAAKLIYSREDRCHGIFHVTNSGECSWFEFAQEIVQLSERLGGPSAAICPIATSGYPTPAKRPANSRLDGTKFVEAYGIRLRSWREALEECMLQIAASGFDVG